MTLRKLYYNFGNMAPDSREKYWDMNSLENLVAESVGIFYVLL